MTSAEYHAVVLTNGQVYYARMEAQENGFLKLNDVFYIISQEGQGPERPRGSLIRRGRELHGPDRMFINRDHVLFVEPVSPGSRLGSLIKDAKNASK